MHTLYLGIDISKAKFDVALLLDTGKLRHKVFPNTEAGYHQLSDWLTKHKVESVHARMEATGTYSDALALYLHNVGQTVSVVNPAIIKAFAATEMSRTKTDKNDASLIARYCLKHQPPPRASPPPEISELQALLRRLDALTEKESNRLDASINAATVRESLKDHIKYLGQQIARTEYQIKDHIDNHPSLKQQRDLLSSIPGIGDLTAAKLLAEIVEISHYGRARQVAAFAGLVPRHNQSGRSVRGKPRLWEVGTGRVRKALYFPAIVATQHNPVIKELSERLRERGKCRMQIIVSAMRKLIHIAFGVLKTGKPFDPNYGKTA